MTNFVTPKHRQTDCKTSITLKSTADLTVKHSMINFVIADAGNNILDYLLLAQICYSITYTVDA